MRNSEWGSGEVPRHGDSLWDGGDEPPQGTLCRTGAGPGELEEGPGRLRLVPAGCCQETGTHSPARPAPASSLPAPGESGLRWGNPGTVTLPALGTAVAPGPCSSRVRLQCRCPGFKEKQPPAPITRWHRSSGGGWAGQGRAGLCLSQPLH